MYICITKANKMKQIIKRNLPLDVQYTVVDKKYIPLLEGGGCTCDNCGQLIANIATVKSVNGTFSIGFDCLETFLLNNNLLDGFDLSAYENVKKMIPQCLRFAKKIKETLTNNKAINITGLGFEKPIFSDWFAFYYLKNNETKSRDNDSIKIKGMDFYFMLTTLKNIFPKLQIFEV